MKTERVINIELEELELERIFAALEKTTPPEELARLRKIVKERKRQEIVDTLLAGVKQIVVGQRKKTTKGPRVYFQDQIDDALYLRNLLDTLSRSPLSCVSKKSAARWKEIYDGHFSTAGAPCAAEDTARIDWSGTWREYEYTFLWLRESGHLSGPTLKYTNNRPGQFFEAHFLKDGERRTHKQCDNGISHGSEPETSLLEGLKEAVAKPSYEMQGKKTIFRKRPHSTLPTV